MDSSILAAYLGIAGAIIAAFLASYWTTHLTNKKAQEKEEHRLELIRINLHKILEAMFLKEIDSQINELLESNKLLQQNILYQKSVFRDSSILKNNLFTSFKEDDLMKICLNRNISFALVFQVFNLLPLLYKKTMFHTHEELMTYLHQLSNARNLEWMLEANDTFIDHPEVQEKVSDTIVIIDKHIVLFKEVKQHIEKLIHDLKSKNA